MSKNGSNTWMPLLRKALRCIDNLSSPPDWTLGGGTVLMLRYQHRVSKDIDIFIHDAQYLTALTPRLNDEVAQLCSNYDESSNFLKLALSEGEIDFIVAPRLLGQDPEPFSFEEREVLMDTSAEIIAKKFFYRSASLKVRDLVDAATVIRHAPQEAQTIAATLLGKRDQILRRVDLLAPTFAERVRQEVHFLPGEGSRAANAIDIVRTFFERAVAP